MTKICEICGNKIVFPNYAVTSDKGIFNPFTEFNTCAKCELDHEIERYMEFKEDMHDPNFHLSCLGKINQLTLELGRTTLF